MSIQMSEMQTPFKPKVGDYIYPRGTLLMAITKCWGWNENTINEKTPLKVLKVREDDAYNGGLAIYTDIFDQFKNEKGNEHNGHYIDEAKHNGLTVVYFNKGERMNDAEILEVF